MVNIIIHGFLSLIKEDDNLGLMSWAAQKQKLLILQGAYSRINKKKYLNIRKYTNTDKKKALTRLFNLFNNLGIFNNFFLF